MESVINFKRGNSVKVFQKVVDGKKERIIAFQGKVMKSRGVGDNRMLTVRQIIDRVDVDRIFPMSAPSIIKIELIEDKKALKKIATRQAAHSKKSLKKTSKV